MEPRKLEILKALFDRFVRQEIIAKHAAKSEIGSDLPELSSLATLLGCHAYDLHVALDASLSRIKPGEYTIERLGLSEEEEEVMWLAVKYKVKSLCARLLDYRREFSHLANELNESDPNLGLTIEELFQFIYPIFLEAAKETFGQE